MLQIPSKATAVTRNRVFNLVVIVFERNIMSVEWRCTMKKGKNLYCITSNWRGFWTGAGLSLSPLQRTSGNPGMLLQALVPGHGGSYSLCKSLKWKRNVTGDFKAKQLFHWVQQCPEIDQLFPLNISYVNVYKMIITALTTSPCNMGRLFSVFFHLPRSTLLTSFSQMFLHNG